MKKHKKTMKYGIDMDLDIEEVMDIYGFAGTRDRIDTTIVNHQIQQKRNRKVDRITNFTIGVGLGLIGYGIYSYVKGE